MRNAKKKIRDWSDKSAQELGRGQANIEDDFRTALELLQVLKILKRDTSSFETEINSKLDNFIRAIIKTEKDFCTSVKYNEVLGILKVHPKNA